MALSSGLRSNSSLNNFNRSRASEVRSSFGMVPINLKVSFHKKYHIYDLYRVVQKCLIPHQQPISLN